MFGLMAELFFPPLNDSENHNAMTKVRTHFYSLYDTSSVPHTLRSEHCPPANFEINKVYIYSRTTRRRADDIVVEEFMPPAVRLQKQSPVLTATRFVHPVNINQTHFNSSNMNTSSIHNTML